MRRPPPRGRKEQPVDKVFAIVRREFVERVRQRWFWIMALLAPLLFAGIIGYQILQAGGGQLKNIVVVDGTGAALGQRLVELFSKGNTFRATTIPLAPGVLDSLAGEVERKHLDGFVILPATLAEDGKAEYRASNVSSLNAIDALESGLNRLVVVARLEAAGVDPRVVDKAQIRVSVISKKLVGGKATDESSGQSFFLAYMMAILLFITILTYGVNVMSSVLEEKTNRVVEVLVSSVKPFQLLFGKVIGVGAVSLFQFMIWGISGRLLLSQRAAIMNRMGPAAQGGFQLPHVSLETFGVFLAFFVGGFLLYSAMFAAVGAMSANEQEARQVQQPVLYLLMISYLSILGLTNDPNSTLSTVLSLFPFTSPIAMPVRWAAGNLSVGDAAISLSILAASILAVTWVASRIYRVGILMTGKRPNVKELIRWVRTA